MGLGLPLLVLVALTVPWLDAVSLWRDEVVSVQSAMADLSALLTLVGRDREHADLANMATYHLLLHFWLGVGETEAHIRLLSVVFGVLSVVPVYLIGRRLAGWPAGALAAAIYVLVPYVIHYSQEARGYSLAMLLGGLLTWLLMVGIERRERIGPWLAYGLLGAVGLYAHFFLALVMAAQGLWVLATRRLPSLWAVLAAGLPIALAMAPIPFIVAEFSGEQAWIQPLTAMQVSANLADLGGGPWPLLALGVLACAALVLRRDATTWLLFGCVALPILGAAAISLAKPLFVARYLVMVLPPLAVLAALGIVAIRPLPLRAVAGVGLAALLVLAVPRAYVDRHEQDWRAAGAWMAEQVRPGDRLIAGNGRRATQYYLERAGAAELPTPTRVALALDDTDTGRVWVVEAGDAADADLVLRLAPAYDIETTRAFGARLTVTLVEPRPG